MKKKCELCGNKKTIEELGTVSCKDCENNYEDNISKWYMLAVGVCFIVLINMYETSTISFIAGLALGVMIGLLLGTKDRRDSKQGSKKE